jgi:hypothetical protein
MTEDKEIEYADIDESDEKEIQEKLDKAKVQYPNWKGKIIGQTLTGTIKEILTFRDLNGKDKHGILMNLYTKSEKFPTVSIWANTVILSGLKKLSKEQNFSNFDMMTQSLKSIEGITIALRYEGEEQPSQKGFKPYQNYSIVEI